MFCATASAQAASACGGTPGTPTWVKPGVYQGTLGKLPVVLKLDRADGGLYFYPTKGLDIPLNLKKSGQNLVLEEQVWTGQSGDWKVTGCFTLSPAGAGMKGKWNAPASKAAQVVNLTPVNATKIALKLPSSPGLLKLRQDDPYTFLKLNRAWVAQAGGKSVKEPLSGVVYPRFPGESAALNAALQDRQLEHAAYTLDCQSQLPADQRGEMGYELQLSPPMWTPKLISLVEDVGYYCGGAHPDGYSKGLILNRTTGREVPLTEFWPTLTPQRLKTLYLTRPAPDQDAQCKDVLTEMTPEFTAYLSPAGLNLIPTSLPHVVAACGDTVTLPLADLRAEGNTKSVYYGDLYK